MLKRRMHREGGYAAERQCRRRLGHHHRRRVGRAGRARTPQRPAQNPQAARAGVRPWHHDERAAGHRTAAPGGRCGHQRDGQPCLIYLPLVSLVLFSSLWCRGRCERALLFCRAAPPRQCLYLAVLCRAAFLPCLPLPFPCLKQCPSSRTSVAPRCLSRPVGHRARQLRRRR